jgi:myosin heavy subunit
VEQEQQAQAKGGMSTMVKVLMWTGIGMVTGFVGIVGFTMFMGGGGAPQQAQMSRPEPLSSQDLNSQNAQSNQVQQNNQIQRQAQVQPQNTQAIQQNQLQAQQQQYQQPQTNQVANTMQRQVQQNNQVATQQIPQLGQTRMITVVDPLTGEKIQIERPVPQEELVAQQQAQEQLRGLEYNTDNTSAGAQQESMALEQQTASNDENLSEVARLQKQFEQAMEIMQRNSERIDELIASGTGKLEKLEEDKAGNEELQIQTEHMKKTIAEQEMMIEEQKSIIAGLESAKRELENRITEITTAHEELLAVKEELLASNEELKVKNEELKASNKELRGANSWLRKLHTDQQRTINAQKEKIAELQSKLAFHKDRPVLPGWKVVGMTEDEVVFYDNYRLLRLKAGEKFEDVQIKDIDVSKGIVMTNFGEIGYGKKAAPKSKANDSSPSINMNSAGVSVAQN